MSECINCGDPPDDDYTLVLPTGVLLQDEPLCTTCRSFFSGAEPFEVHAAPVMLRGGDGTVEDDDRAAEELERAQS